MPMAIVSFGTPVFENRPSRTASVACHSWEDADQLARSLVKVFSGEEKEPGYFMLTNRTTRVSWEPSARDFWVEVVPNTPCCDLSADELVWLRVFANQHGRQWKSKLRAMWFNNQDVGIARALRNNTAFAQGLPKFKLPEV